MAFRSADSGEIKFVVDDIAIAVLGSQAEIPGVGACAERYYLF